MCAIRNQIITRAIPSTDSDGLNHQAAASTSISEFSLLVTGSTRVPQYASMLNPDRATISRGDKRSVSACSAT
ncbi:MAG: hypothetical protein E6G67_03640 [Actinobacteria bacterium]|nr:MAG: hypothetical protein E6G67_03640 [Actinomycetota bacterium]